MHDYATQRGGAERVALDLLKAFPNSKLITSCWNPQTTFPEFEGFPIETLWTDRVKAFRSDPRRAFPVLARAFSERLVTDADVVICSSSGWAHMINTPVPKIVYCHNPARWLYQPADYFSRAPGWVRASFAARTQRLRTHDFFSASTAHSYAVNSTAVARRVHATYGIDATIVPPARGLDPDGEMEQVPGVEPGFLLTVSRRRGYKHTDLICEAVSRMPDERLVVVGGASTECWPHRITGLHGLNDSQLRWLYANAAGLVAVGHEDFGLTPVEAQAFGIPCLTLRSGGYLDTTVEDVTGLFVDSTSIAEIADGIRELRAREWDADAIRLHGERYSRSAFAGRIRRMVDDVQHPTSVEHYPTQVASIARFRRRALSA